MEVRDHPWGGFAASSLHRLVALGARLAWYPPQFYDVAAHADGVHGRTTTPAAENSSKNAPVSDPK
jgi:hypothetical protein